MKEEFFLPAVAQSIDKGNSFPDLRVETERTLGLPQRP
jgi:hypothetical protein